MSEVSVKKENFISKFFSNMKINRRISKQEKEIKKIQSDIVDQYRLIGEKVYQYNIKGADVGEEFEPFCTTIKNKVGIIVEHGKEINELKKKRK